METQPQYRIEAEPDALITAAGYLNREWGSYGYRVEGIDSPTSGGVRLFVRHLDGSRFTVEVDRWGNVQA